MSCIPTIREALIATGFNRHFPDEFNAVNLEQRRQEILNDMTDTTVQVVLGLTAGCARCHDHKFDPISQEDYYRLQAFFAAYQPADRPTGRHDEMEQYRTELRQWEAKTADLRKKMRRSGGAVSRTLHRDAQEAFPEGISGDVRAAGGQARRRCNSRLLTWSASR